MPKAKGISLAVAAIRDATTKIISEAQTLYGPTIFSRGPFSDDRIKTFHGLNHCREISHLIKQSLTNVQLLQVADSQQNNHHFLIFDPQIYGTSNGATQPNPLIIDPTYKQFFSFAAMDGVLNFTLQGNPKLVPLFLDYRRSYQVTEKKISQMQAALSTLDPFFIGPQSELKKLMQEVGEIREEVYGFPKAIADEMEKTFQEFLGTSASWVEVKDVGNPDGSIVFKLDEEPLFSKITPKTKTKLQDSQPILSQHQSSKTL